MPISQELKAWFSDLTDNSPFFFSLLSEELKYVSVSKRYEQVTGLTGDELIGQNDIKVFGQNFYNQISPLYDRALGGEVVESEISFKLNDIEQTLYCVCFPTTISNKQIIVFQGVDVSERSILSSALIESEKKFNSLLHSVTDGVILADDNAILAMNLSATNLLGHESTQELLGENLNSLFIDPKTNQKFTSNIIELVKRTSPLTCITSPLCGSDKTLEIRYSKASLLGTSLDFVMIRDHLPEQNIERPSDKSDTPSELTIDGLTGLYNRSGFIKRLDRFIKDQTPLILFYLDIDNFKSINDSLGHSIGDKVIREISARLKRIVPSNAVLGHLGADEFAIILPEPEMAQLDEQLSEKIISLINQPFNLNYFSKRLACSIGTVAFPENGTDGRSLLQNADTAMFEAKARGRNRMIAFNEQMNKEARTKLWLEIELQKALQQNGLEVWYQPKVSAKDYSINGAEALVRWKHPVEGYISPGAFIPMAEKAGLIEQVGRVVMREVFATVKRWRQQKILPGRVAINLSPEQFGNPKLIDYMEQLLKSTKLDPACITFELTESAVMSDSAHTLQMLNAIKNLGFTLSIDDFGTGYSSLSYLARFPINELKIDRAFISDVDTLPKQVTVIENIINLGKSLSLSVVAEGVETQSQAQLLSSLNCNSIQGFHFYRPQPKNEIEILFAKQTRRRH
ncbi:bifunctional diguanylate cyclase/phosphodiesterase [Vibrio viridaestus]|uniref:cyclic-guanylate-specific phosphodiesterase n=1 Tax=Vibrio viridaestus TaxID=2487322 RepID=A0A3N9THU9_9VIBR|nr:bifunctional diguanylate cyclase/phosphodiesterase [Vibrio viridaestus]RQW63868.1 bifunctional diguanylate cyclase/phosphodiesterase [Vibrio viridaestus]